MIKKNNLGPGLVIGIPTLGRPVSLDWAMAFKALNPPINFNVNFVFVRNQQVANARNAIVKQALAVGAKYIFFLGDDTIPPAHALRQLLYRMDNHEVDVVGGVYCAKCDPPAPLVFMENGIGSYWDWKIGEFFQCSGLGADCLLVRTSIFERLSEPWFKTVDTDKYLDGISAAETWTEDLYFFNKLREELDISPWCDGSVICEHVDVYSGKVYSLPKDSLPLRLRITNKDKKCLMLGPPIELNDETYEIVTVGEGGDYRASFDNLPFAENEFDWLVVTNIEESFKPNLITELLRVTKSKVSINCHPWINPNFVIEYLSKLYSVKCSIDGSFIEMVKNAQPDTN